MDTPFRMEELFSDENIYAIARQAQPLIKKTLEFNGQRQEFNSAFSIGRADLIKFTHSNRNTPLGLLLKPRASDLIDKPYV